MERWEAMRVLLAAHQVGLAMMDSLAQPAVDMREGRRSEAAATFEKALEFFEGDLKLHFDHEERALFPVLGRIIGRDGPIGAMLGEHDSLWRCVDELVEEVDELREDGNQADAKCVKELQRLANHIVFLLRGHIQREDTMLFPLAERSLDARGKQEVDEAMEMVNRLAREASYQRTE